MRAVSLVITVAVAAAAGGCAGQDPFAGAPQKLSVAALPGGATSASAAIARTRGAYLLSWRDGSGIHARILADGNDAPNGIDRALGPGELAGVAGLTDGFAVAVVEPAAVAVHFLDANGANDVVQRVTLAGTPLTYIASDGQRVIVAATSGGEIAIDGPRPLYATLAIVSSSGSRVIDLGQVGAPPSLWGDASGFVVAGKQLLDGAGTMVTAPGEQISAARMFRKPVTSPQPTRDDISNNGKSWLALDGLASAAASTGSDTLLQLDSGELERVGADLTLRARFPLPSVGRLVTAGDDVILWGRSDDESAFVTLDAASAAVRGAWIQIPDADRDSISVALGTTDVLFAWNDSSAGDPIVKWARVKP